MQNLIELVSMRAIDVLENVLSELLDGSYDVPRVVVVDRFANVVEYPPEFQASRVECVDEVVDGLFLNLVVIKGNTQVGGEVEFACQIAQHTLEERIDGLHAEIAVVVDEVLQGDSSSFGGCFLRDAQVGGDTIHVVGTIVEPFPNSIQLTEDSGLHLFGGLVGEGHSEYSVIGERIGNEQLDILHSQTKSLACASACLIDG